MDWVESSSSQLLWIDGNHILRRYTFSASFIAPLVLFGGDNSESSLVLRHFRGDHNWALRSNYRALIQLLLTQLFKQRWDLWGNVSGALIQESGAIFERYGECSPSPFERRRHHAFLSLLTALITLDLKRQQTADSVEEREPIMTFLNDLVKEPGIIIKILLTARLSHSTRTGNVVMVGSLSSTVRHQPKRQLSMAASEEYLASLSHKLVEIHEKRSISSTFLQDICRASIVSDPSQFNAAECTGNLDAPFTSLGTGRENLKTASDIDLELSPVSHLSLKPFVAMTCPPTIRPTASMIISGENWTYPQFHPQDIFDKLFIPESQHNNLMTMVRLYQDPDNVPSSSTLVLLHRGAGTGKTTSGRLTAELQRLLLSVPSADITVYGNESGKHLQKMLYMTSRWNAVLLLESIEHSSTLGTKILSQLMRHLHHLLSLVIDRERGSQ
ncbi:hypothetical protein BDV26DRAFT_288258 [Aspergillus bertholletiae]|uniref:Uncharacterized protein n=1 Tax=Aspergillus bertholletiae TaxID=1226010 RepID=A0A5N7BLN6_9EURO|nr:hypothetical protein BDV26DRAFT_288258 [Aspergillus bertholletiae]